MIKQYYLLLGIDEYHSLEEIKKQYYILVKRYHPDINKDNDAESKLKKINEAYEYLKKHHQQKIRKKEFKHDPTQIKLYRRLGVLTTINKKAKYLISVPPGFSAMGGIIYVKFENISQEIRLEWPKRLSAVNGQAIVKLDNIEILFIIEELDEREFF